MKKRTKWLLSALAVASLTGLFIATPVKASELKEVSWLIQTSGEENMEVLGAEEEEKITVDGVVYAYNKAEDSYWAIGVEQKTGELVIHGEVNGKPVNRVGQLNAYDVNAVSEITKVTVEEGVKILSERALEFFSSVQEINLPASLEKIFVYAFREDFRLVNINVAEGGKQYSSKDGILYNADKSQIICYPSRKEIKILASVEALADDAFQAHRESEAVVVEDGNKVFKAYEGVLYAAKDMCVAVYCPRGLAGEVEILPDATWIMKEAFNDCTNITKIVIPAKMELIETYFENCYALKEVSVDPNNNIYCSIDGALYNKAVTELLLCPNKKVEINIPDTVKTIGVCAFRCGDIKSIVLPDSVETIHLLGLAYCSNLESVKISKNLCRIDGAWAFSGWNKIEKIELPDTLEYMSYGTFEGCNSLKELVLPSMNCVYEDNAIQKTEGLKIYCYPGSSAEKYAKDNQIECVYLEGQPPVEKAFKDIEEKAWYVDSVQFVYNNKIMSGKGAGNFKPLDLINRSEFAQVLYNMLDKPEIEVTSKFADVKAGDWFANAVSWAYVNNIASGYPNGTFGVYDNITREQMAVMLYKFAKLRNLDLMTNVGNTDSFPDAGKISEWAKEAMDWATTQGVINGKKVKDGGVILDPQGRATRAECAAMMKNLLEKQNAKGE